jgi:NAD(P)-dependent dehydrogenase (short-subunit alcohol dehydrogenase family)
VTGGASGSVWCAERMLAEGASAVLSDVRADTLEEAVAGLARRHGRDAVRGVVVDVRSAASVRGGFAEAVLAFGGVDIVVNNAGLSVSKPLAETSESDYDLMNDVMPRGSFLSHRRPCASSASRGRAAPSSTWSARTRSSPARTTWRTARRGRAAAHRCGSWRPRRGGGMSA